MIFSGKARQEFQVESITSKEMERFINRCSMIYQGHPDWMKENVKTVNFAKAVCSEVARLATVGAKVSIEGSARAEWLQEQIDDVYYQIRNWVEYGAACGTIVLKPNGESIDLVLPDKYMVTGKKNGKINGIVFVNNDVAPNGKVFYTRLEYHRFLENGLYCITNKCYQGATANDISKELDIEDSPWSNMQAEVTIADLDNPLYAVLKMPGANYIDADSPLGMPIFAQAVEELRDLDIAYSRNAEEVFDSERTVLLDTDKLINRKGMASSVNVQKSVRDMMELPKYVRTVQGNGNETIYQEINPTLNTATRLAGIDALLSEIGFKCGFSNGYFVFNQKTGMVTATQVESDDRRTLQTIKDVRDQLESCLDHLIYALDSFASLYDLAPVGEYEIVYDFDDLTANIEEDRARWWGYVNAGKIPAWLYFSKFEGYGEDEAKQLVDEAGQENQMKGLFEE